MPIGVHTSIAGGLYLSVDRASELGCDAMQIFGRNPRSWAFKPIPPSEAEMFKARRAKAKIWPVIVHTTYLINLCAPDTANFDKSVDLFKKEVGIAEELGADYLVTHLGSPGELGGEFALKRIGSALKDVSAGGLGKKATVLFENTAGGGYSFGSRLADIRSIIDGAAGSGLKTGLCFDTCHAFAAGYPMRTPEEIEGLVRTIDKEVGLPNLKVIHLNDSKGAISSNLDRHEHIGKGKIGLDAFRYLLNHKKIRSIPMILETPKKTPQDDPYNLKTVRDLTGR